MKKITRKSIETNYPDWKILGTTDNWTVHHIPTMTRNCCILKGCNLKDIENLISNQDSQYKVKGSFDRAYFRPNTNPILLTRAQLHHIYNSLKVTTRKNGGNFAHAPSYAKDEQQLESAFITQKIFEALELNND